MGNTAKTFMTQISDYETSKRSFIVAYNQFARFLVRSATLIMFISYADSKYIEPYHRWVSRRK